MTNLGEGDMMFIKKLLSNGLTSELGRQHRFQTTLVIELGPNPIKVFGADAVQPQRK